MMPGTCDVATRSVSGAEWMKLFFFGKRRKADDARSRRPEIAAMAAPPTQMDDNIITIDQLDESAQIFLDESRHGELGTKTLKLPDWFDHDLAPDSEAFRAQQLRLWEAVTARSAYDPR